MAPDISRMVRGEDASGGDQLDTRILRKMNENAKQFLQSFSWCDGIQRSYFGDGFGGIIAAFLIEQIPRSEDVDTWLWVIVGDVPPAYLVTDDIPDAASALETYVGLISEWIDAVENNRSVEGLLPVDAPSTPQVAAMLRSRVEAIGKLGLCKGSERLN